MNEISTLPSITMALGVDVVRTGRIAGMLDRWNGRFIQRFLTTAENAQCHGRPERIAALVAAKEACSKALGTGMRGVGWREIEILHEPTGQPVLILHHRALKQSQKLGWLTTSISLTHDGGITIAVVAALAQGQAP